MASLYETLGTRVEQADGEDPGTAITKAVETVDNDHASAVLPLASKSREVDPGTIITHAVETVDNDHATALIGLISTDPKPGPGTAMTATIEDLDPDRVGEFHAISTSRT